MKDVLISITGTQGGDGPDESVQLITGGKYCYNSDNGESVLTYTESELTGLDGTETSFTIGSGGIIMQREGRTNTRMVFEEGRKHTFLYDTPFGAATMGVNTRKLKADLGEHGGDMVIDYVLDFDHAVVGSNKFVINVKEIGPQ